MADPEASGTACTICEIVLEQISSHNTNETYAEFEKTAQADCALDPKLQKECDGMRD